MQREIEFRIWDNELKRFDGPSCHSLQSCDYDKYKIDVLFHIKKIFGEECVKQRFTVQQYTGLKDKNGVKIFEGDIIRHGCTTQEYESVVAYKAPAFIAKTFFYRRFSGLSNTNSWDVMWEKRGVEAFNKGWYMGDRSFIGENYIEVIGNIFENPEIL